jgi:hypothetical protein
MENHRKKTLFYDFLIYPLVCTLLYSFLSLLYFNKIVVEPHHQVAQPDETMTYEDNIDEEEARVDIDLRRFSSDHHYQVESN